MSVFSRNIEVFLTGSSVSPDDVRGKTAVIVDVLRASTTIVAALANGAREVIPVPDMGEAGKMAAALDPASFLLGGDKGGVRIEGYHLGNSPAEYAPTVVEGKTVILHTTNGTGAILASGEAEEVLVGGFVNASAVVEAVRRADRDVVIVCAGWRNRVALEDTICAGLLVDRLLGGESPSNLSDTAYIALWQYRHDRADLAVPIGRCNHAQRLERLGHQDDIPVCIALDSLPYLVGYSEQRLTLVPAEATGREGGDEGRPRRSPASPYLRS